MIVREAMMLYVGFLVMGALLVTFAAYPLYVAASEFVRVVGMVVGL